MSIYAPLQERLANASQPAVTLSFDEIEQLLGRKLPQSAYDERIKRQWWANTDTHSQARAWLKAGRKAKLDAARNNVTFVRHTEAATDSATIALAALTPVARQLLTETAKRRGVDMAEALAVVVNDAARAARRHVLEDMDRIRGRSIRSDVSSVELLREDRDAR